MEIIGVIDLRRGRAVHAVAGERDRYAPVGTAAGVRIDGDPATLARAYAERLGVRELYVADLDAIVDGRPNDAAIDAIASVGSPLWLDAGVASTEAAARVAALRVHTVIVGLETLTSWRSLGEIVEALGGHRVAFSLDLRHGRPMGMLADDWLPERIAARAAGAGVGTLVVLDLARVGAGAGLDAGMLARVRDAVPSVRLAAGGGVRGPGDLEQLAAAGCDAALVATALHEGRLDAAAVMAARMLALGGAQRSVSR